MAGQGNCFKVQRGLPWGELGGAGRSLLKFRGGLGKIKQVEWIQSDQNVPERLLPNGWPNLRVVPVRSMEGGDPRHRPGGAPPQAGSGQETGTVTLAFATTAWSQIVLTRGSENLPQRPF